VVLEKPFCNLVRFKSKKPNARKVLVVAPLSGHHATLLRDTVRALLAEHDVWISDWVNARLVPLTAGPFHLADYVDYVRDWIRMLSPDVHVISVCQPTVPVLAAVSLMAARGRRPTAHDDDDGRADRRATQPDGGQQPGARKPYSWFEQNVIQRVPRNIPATCGACIPASCSTSASWR
jgi:poly(3-hydroxybutyrate) depolymerase